MPLHPESHFRSSQLIQLVWQFSVLPFLSSWRLYTKPFLSHFSLALVDAFHIEGEEPQLPKWQIWESTSLCIFLLCKKDTDKTLTTYQSQEGVIFVGK